jgi:hypothetical protein
MKALNTIPHISVETLTPDFMRVTAIDGFSLALTRIDTMHGKFWKFDPRSTVSELCHFHLRYLIDRALNA